MAPCFLAWRMVPAGPKYSTVIPRSEATWESPGKMFVSAQQIDEWHREIATGLTALAMTYKSRCFFCVSNNNLARERPRLPLMRELSAKLTEGEIFNSQIYVFAYTAKIAVNIQITDSNHC